MFSELKEGDKISCLTRTVKRPFKYRFEGDFVVAHAYKKNGKTFKILAEHADGRDPITLDESDADLIEKL